MAEKSSELNYSDQTENGENPVEELNSEETKYQNETNDSANLDEPDQIREQIEETRREMGETIDAIQERLSISNISEQVKEQVSEQITNAVETAKDAVYEATIKKAGNFMHNIQRELNNSKIIKVIDENPFPFVFIGLGIGMLLFKGYKKNPSTKYQKKNKNFKSDEQSMIKSAQTKVTDLAGQTYDNISNVAETAYEGVTNATNSAIEGVKNTAGNTYQKIGDLGNTAREKYDHYIEENPLAVGVAALAVGAAIGLAMPSTSYENELFGQANANLRAKAEEVTRDAFEKVQHLASDLGNSIAKEAKTPEN